MKKQSILLLTALLLNSITSYTMEALKKDTGTTANKANETKRKLSELEEKTDQTNEVYSPNKRTKIAQMLPYFWQDPDTLHEFLSSLSLFELRSQIYFADTYKLKDLAMQAKDLYAKKLDVDLDPLGTHHSFNIVCAQDQQISLPWLDVADFYQHSRTMQNMFGDLNDQTTDIYLSEISASLLPEFIELLRSPYKVYHFSVHKLIQFLNMANFFDTEDLLRNLIDVYTAHLVRNATNINAFDRIISSINNLPTELQLLIPKVRT